MLEVWSTDSNPLILMISASCTAIQRLCVPVPSQEEGGGLGVRKGIRPVENTASNHMMSLGLIVEPVQPVRGMDNGR